MCYLERTSHTPPAAPPLTLDPSISCSLFQPLGSPFPTPVLCFQQLAASFCRTPGVGAPRKNRPVESATYSLFSRGLSIIWLTPLDSVSRCLCGKSIFTQVTPFPATHPGNAPVTPLL